MMKLKVLNASAADAPWFAEGLSFTCTACGNCCTGGPGVVWVTPEEGARVAKHLKISTQEMTDQYCRTVSGRLSFKEVRRGGLYDCVFLREHPPGATADDGTPLRGRGCSIYSVRPLQCRTWPFWAENVESQAAWNRAARKCHGMNHGDRHFDQGRIEALRDAEEWPKDPPSSKK